MNWSVPQAIGSYRLLQLGSLARLAWLEVPGGVERVLHLSILVRSAARLQVEQNPAERKWQPRKRTAKTRPTILMRLHLAMPTLETQG